MRVTPIRTQLVTAGATSVEELLDAYLPHVGDGCIVAVTSKVVSLCENRVVPYGSTTKLALVRQECDRYVAEANSYGFHFTITNDTLIPSAGIDESNGGGDYILWPKEPQASVDRIRQHLQMRTGARDIGAILTDSSCTPLRRGTSGICLAHSGFRAANDYVGTLDLFGRAFLVSQANVAGGLAAAAVLTMGEGDERTPICLLEDLPFVHFEDRDPGSAAQKEDAIRPEEDLYSLFLESIDWISGDRVRGQ